MIRTWIFLALWAALPALGQVGATALYTQFQHDPSTNVITAMRAESGALLEPDGLQFAWRLLPEKEQKVWSEIAVVTFSGRCEALPFASNSHPDKRLGWTHISDGVVLPFAEIDCDAVRAFLLPDLTRIAMPERESVYGRALGRVLAHELLHVFARSAHHSDHGVDQPSLSKGELLSERMTLDHERATMVHLGGPAETGPRSVSQGRSAFLREGCATCHGDKGQGTPHGPALKLSGRVLDSVILTAKLSKSQQKMVKAAHGLKVGAPTVEESDLADLALFLSDGNR